MQLPVTFIQVGKLNYSSLIKEQDMSDATTAWLNALTKETLVSMVQNQAEQIKQLLGVKSDFQLKLDLENGLFDGKAPIDYSKGDLKHGALLEIVLQMHGDEQIDQNLLAIATEICDMPNVVKRLQQNSLSVIPNDWVLVPKEPTEAMLLACDAVHSAWLHDDAAGVHQPIAAEYKAMLAAAPEAPK